MSLASLHDHLVSKLAAASPGTVVAFGEKEIAKQINQGTGRGNRVVIAPGDEGGALGGYEAPAAPGYNVDVRDVGRRLNRSLWDWTLAARVYVWGFDRTAPDDEKLQWIAMTELHDCVIEAIHSYASGGYKIRAPRNTSKTVERGFGRETMFVLELRQPVLTSARPRTGAFTATGPTYLGDTGTDPA